MHNASEFIRRVCLSLLLVCALIGSAPAGGGIGPQRAPRENGMRRSVVRRSRIRAKAHRSHLRRTAKSSYMRASVRIPTLHPQFQRLLFRRRHFRPRTNKEFRGKRPRKTAALQGIIRDASTRGIRRSRDRSHQSRDGRYANDFRRCRRRVPPDAISRRARICCLRRATASRR